MDAYVILDGGERNHTRLNPEYIECGEDTMETQREIWSRVKRESIILYNGTYLEDDFDSIVGRSLEMMREEACIILLHNFQDREPVYLEDNFYISSTPKSMFGYMLNEKAAHKLLERNECLINTFTTLSMRGVRVLTVHPNVVRLKNHAKFHNNYCLDEEFHETTYWRRFIIHFIFLIIAILLIALIVMIMRKVPSFTFVPVRVIEL